MELLVDGDIQDVPVAKGDRLTLMRRMGEIEWEADASGESIVLEPYELLKRGQAKVVGRLPEDEMTVLKVMKI